MKALSEIGEGFRDGMRLAWTLIWTVPKTVAHLLFAVLVSFVRHRPYNFANVAKTIDQAGWS